MGGRRFASLILKKAEIDPTKRAGTLTKEEIDKIVAIIEDPISFKIPAWFLNRQRDPVTGKTYQVHAQQIAGTLRNDLERLKKMRCHRGLPLLGPPRPWPAYEDHRPPWPYCWCGEEVVGKSKCFCELLSLFRRINICGAQK